MTFFAILPDGKHDEKTSLPDEFLYKKMSTHIERYDSLGRPRNYCDYIHSSMSLQQMSSVYFKSEIRRKVLICTVCGERARGYNFGAVTCMSCKMFFHRNAWNNTVSLGE